MGGRMGTDRVTVRCDLVKIDPEKNILLLRGPVPGGEGGLVFVRQSKIDSVVAARRERVRVSAEAAAKSGKGGPKKAPASAPVKK
jgi:large subunit ribosomal protein L3